MLIEAKRGTPFRVALRYPYINNALKFLNLKHSRFFLFWFMLELLEGQIMAGYVVMTMLVSAFMTGGLAAGKWDLYIHVCTLVNHLNRIVNVQI